MEAMNSNAVTVKIEPPDDFDAGTSENVSPTTLQNGITENSDPPPSKKGTSNSFNDSRNFTCLLCDIVCNSRDELRKHLKNTHASKSYSTMNNSMYLNKISSEATTRAFSGYVNYRYTCPICGAKFKSFRTYLTHNMSHRGASGLQPFDEARMAALFGTGKQYMQDYLEAEEGYAGTFTCNECKTVFVQRDAYAMHMMMRAMKGTCKTANSLYENSSHSTSNDCELKHVPNGTDVRLTNQSGELSTVSIGQTNQRCLEDVTAKIDQDEYLKSVLDKVCASDVTKLEVPNYNMDERKVCSFCTDSFVDQDSLAMHVMSDHADEMSSSSSRNNNCPRGPNHEDYLAWMAVATKPLMISSVCKYCNETFMSRDSLALHVLTHAHLDERTSGQSRKSFKRKSDVPETGSSLLQSPKLLKFNTGAETKHPSGFTTPKEQANNEVDSNLYCKECDIKFYAVSEYRWHMERHNGDDTSSYDEPLCLTKHSERNYLSCKNELSTNVSAENSQRRRNSFSSTEQKDVLTRNDILPQRPVSVGDCSRNTLKELSKSHNEHRQRDSENNTKTLDEKTMLDTINALSTSEQRIIYSVFGSDLGLKIENAEELSESSRSCTPPVDLSSAKRKIAQEDADTDTGMVHCDTDVHEITKNEDSDENLKVIPGDPNKPMCKYCEILFFNKAIYYLHMGLHNVNNPWQCNICGKICKDAVDFAAHVIHM
ncbi:zinc finger protein 354A-like [Mercenaria mercenaria]|uniref:zinc finger protein 354A-like n=1 Tax=Mercenaria mercenaria TaxID=6596 RepID=UPI00234F8669|nr:zinc finger protein 354A-like [Mercenaria mercenaria]